MATIILDLDPETMLKLTRRAARAGMTPERAAQLIATKGVQFFLAYLVAPTKRGKTAARNGKGVRG